MKMAVPGPLNWLHWEVSGLRARLTDLPGKRCDLIEVDRLVRPGIHQRSQSSGAAGSTTTSTWLDPDDRHRSPKAAACSCPGVLKTASDVGELAFLERHGSRPAHHAPSRRHS